MSIVHAHDFDSSTADVPHESSTQDARVVVGDRTAPHLASEDGLYFHHGEPGNNDQPVGLAKDAGDFGRSGPGMIVLTERAGVEERAAYSMVLAFRDEVGGQRTGNLR